MYERMLNKKVVPTDEEIMEHIGKKSIENIELIKKSLEKIHDTIFELRFPYGNKYGWGYRVAWVVKIGSKPKYLFDIFFEKGSINIMCRLKIQTEDEIEKYNKLSEEGKKYWENRYPCGGENSGWIKYRVINKNQLKDIGIFLNIKTKEEIKI